MQNKVTENIAKIDNFVLIIGAMKCGTTSLFKYLSEHPEILPCKYKEYNFFANQDNFNQGVDFYHSLWDWNPNLHHIALQAPTNHTRITHPDHVNAAKNIAAFQRKTNANFKFIYLIRNPIDRIESHYNHILAGAEHTQKSLSEAIKQEALDTSRYAMQLDEYYQRFPSDSILLLNTDDLKRDPINVVKGICQFIDVDDSYEFKGLNIVHKKGKERKIISNPVYELLRSNILVGATLKKLSLNSRAELGKIARSLFGKNPQRIRLSSDERNDLLKSLSADLQKLEQQYDFDLSSWKVDI